MVIAETMLAASLLKGAITSVKSLLNSAQDVQSIYKGLDVLFTYRDAASKELEEQKKRNTDDEDLSITSIAASVLEQKRLDRQIANIGAKIDNKFGLGTWQEIIDLREKKIEEREVSRKVTKEKAKKVAKKKKEHRKDLTNKIYIYSVEFIKVVFLVSVAIGLGYIVWTNRCQGTTCL
jgi:pantothenate kinase|tara:strand:- start:618 stop:1151 length:534 start_codon:yes stop_codon:yes gene_type:complete